MNEPLPNLLRRVLAIRAAGRSCFACLVVHSRGSTPQTAGALMVVDDALNTFGTIGGGCVEAEVRRRAFELMSRGQTGLLSFKLDHDYGWDDGLICGGTLELAVAPLPPDTALHAALEKISQRVTASLDFEVATDQGAVKYTLNIPARERLLIAGAGHVGQALARLALNLEFDVSVYDDRADLMEKFVPAGAQRIAGDIAENLRSAPLDDQTYCVIVTRGHRHDEQALHAVVGRGARYVGMIGSRRKVKLIFDDLRELGTPDAALLEVHAPVGLAIGAVSVEEIALSIAAQLVEVRRERAVPIVIGPANGRAEARAEP